MKNILATIIISVFTIASLGFMSDADAKKRFGGGKSSGMQRDSVQRDPTPPPAKSPAAATPQQAGAATPAAAAAPAASGMSKWAGPLAGIAAGGLLAALFFGGAFDGIKFFDILLIIGFAVAGFMLLRMFMRKKMAAQAASGNYNTPNTMQYEGVGGAANPTTPPPAEVTLRTASAAPATLGGRVVAPEIGSKLMTANATPDIINAVTAKPRIPADFDVAPFERQARAAFIRLQAANDAKDLNDIRDFTTPEMYAEIALQMQERGDVAQKTEVVSVDARVIEVVVDSARAVASVRYTGVIREDGEGAEGFDEVWHVIKDVNDNNSTWRLAGIQQLDV
jgi:predicted lipid-binding transport protein (Tim44 family)